MPKVPHFRLPRRSLQLHGWITSLQLCVWGRPVRTLRGLFDVPGGLRTVSPDDHHHDHRTLPVQRLLLLRVVRWK